MGALDQLRYSASRGSGFANGGGIVERLRSSRRLVVAVAAGGLLLIAWITWAVYVTGDSGAEAGLGVVIAWPAMLAALVLISLPFIGAYLLVRRIRSDEEPDPAEDGDAEAPESDEATFKG